MEFLHIYYNAFLLIIGMMSIVWLLSVITHNVSIVDIFWGLGFVAISVFYFLNTGEPTIRKNLLILLVTIWGLRLSLYIAWRNYGKGEDYRYREFRKKYGEKRYWWISFFQTFLLQGTLMWLVSAPLLGAQFYSTSMNPGILDFAGYLVWIIGFIFEAGGDYQLAVFKANPDNKGRVLNKGLWRYTRHPNYFGDSAVWWGYALICLGAGSWVPLFGSLLMTALIIKISGVALLEKNLEKTKPNYREYIEKTSSFLPWFPRK